MSNPPVIVDLTLSEDEEEQQERDKAESPSPLLLVKCEASILPRKKRPKLCASKTILSKVAGAYSYTASTRTSATGTTNAVTTAAATTNPANTALQTAAKIAALDTTAATTTSATSPVNEATTSTSTANSFNAARSTATINTTATLTERPATKPNTASPMTTTSPATTAAAPNTRIHRTSQPRKLPPSPLLPKKPYQHALFSHDSISTTTTTPEKHHNTTLTPKPHDTLFDKDPILNPQEMEVLYLGVESMYCLRVDDFDWGFVYEHASEALRVELRQDTSLQNLIRWDDWIVRKRFDILKETLWHAMIAGYRRPAMARVLCERWRGSPKHHRLRQNFTKWFT